MALLHLIIVIAIILMDGLLGLSLILNLYKNDLGFLKYGFYDEKFKIVSDWKFFAKCICLYNVTVKNINDFLCNYD